MKTIESDSPSFSQGVLLGLSSHKDFISSSKLYGFQMMRGSVGVVSGICWFGVWFLRSGVIIEYDGIWNKKILQSECGLKEICDSMWYCIL